jgi:hypothetical protein
MAAASSWVVCPTAPKFIAPSASELTWTPVRPKVRVLHEMFLLDKRDEPAWRRHA